MKLALMQTSNVIGEATNHAIWGTGLPIRNEQAFKCKMWNGKNLMRSLLKQVKKSLEIKT